MLRAAEDETSNVGETLHTHSEEQWTNPCNVLPPRDRVDISLICRETRIVITLLQIR